MSESKSNVVWRDFEIDGKLNEDEEYRKLANFNYGLVCGRLPPGTCCTAYANAFITQFKIDLKKYRLGAVRIGPSSDGHSYTHEAVGIAEKNSEKVIAVFDPIENRIGGQANTSCSTANKRYPLQRWLDYKTRLHHPFVSDWNRPFSVFLLKEIYNKPRCANFSWVLHVAIWDS